MLQPRGISACVYETVPTRLAEAELRSCYLQLNLPVLKSKSFLEEKYLSISHFVPERHRFFSGGLPVCYTVSFVHLKKTLIRNEQPE